MLNNRNVAEQYLAAWNRRDADAIEALIEDDVTFIGPMSQSQGRAAFIQGVKAMFPILKGVEVRELLTSERGAVAIYDFNCVEPVGRCRTSELLSFKDGRISSSELFFDARPFEAMMKARVAAPAEQAA